MMQCDECRAQIVFYLDDELSGNDRSAFESHVERCAACREMLDREKRLFDRVRSVRPLHQAPPALRKRVETLLTETVPASGGSKREAPPVPEAKGRGRRGLARRFVAWAAAVVIGLSGLWAVLQIDWPEFRGHSSEFAQLAVDAHQRYLRDALPLELVTENPDEVSAWFENKVPFRLVLPSYQETSGQKKIYSLKGARLIGFDNGYAAYVAYEMTSIPISLVVTSGDAATPSGGERVVMRGLVFHHQAIAGYKVITWSDHGLTYALVSSLAGRGEESCRVCHAGAANGELLGVGF